MWTATAAAAGTSTLSCCPATAPSGTVSVTLRPLVAVTVSLEPVAAPSGTVMLTLSVAGFSVAGILAALTVLLTLSSGESKPRVRYGRPRPVFRKRLGL